MNTPAIIRYRLKDPFHTAITAVIIPIIKMIQALVSRLKVQKKATTTRNTTFCHFQLFKIQNQPARKSAINDKETDSLNNTESHWIMFSLKLNKSTRVKAGIFNHLDLITLLIWNAKKLQHSKEKIDWKIAIKIKLELNNLYNNGTVKGRKPSKKAALQIGFDAIIIYTPVSVDACTLVNTDIRFTTFIPEYIRNNKTQTIKAVVVSPWLNLLFNIRDFWKIRLFNKRTIKMNLKILFMLYFS